MMSFFRIFVEETETKRSGKMDGIISGPSNRNADLSANRGSECGRQQRETVSVLPDPNYILW